MDDIRSLRVFPLLSLILLVFHFHVFAQRVSDCGWNVTGVLQGVIEFDTHGLDTNITECQWNITDDVESYIQIILTEADVDIGNGSALVVIDGIFGEIFRLTPTTDIESSRNVTVNSLTNYLYILFVTNDDHRASNSSFVIPFVILSKHNSTTTLYADQSGIISSSGTTGELIVNYVHTHLIDVGDEYSHVYLFLDKMSLDDSSGDFLTVGTGDVVFCGPPALLFTGTRSTYIPIEIQSGIAYLHVYVRYFNVATMFSFFYNSSVFGPPIVVPTTISSPIPLNVTINFNHKKDNFDLILTQFVNVMSFSSIRYCNSKNLFLENEPISNETKVDVVVIEAVSAYPCLVFVFYIILLENETCQGHKPFTVDDFQYMMGNYTPLIEKEFGRPILLSCELDVTIWVLFVSIVFCFSLTLTIVVAMIKRRNENYKKLAKMEMTSSDELIRDNPLFGVKVADDDPYVIWSESERPSLATIKQPNEILWRTSSLKKGFRYRNSVNDSPTNERHSGMDQCGDTSDDSSEDEVFDRGSFHSEEAVTHGSSLFCTERPSIEFSSRKIWHPTNSDAMNGAEGSFHETKL